MDLSLFEPTFKYKKELNSMGYRFLEDLMAINVEYTELAEGFFYGATYRLI
jgi:hypothetical protein